MLKIDSLFKLSGKIRKRSVNEIHGSNWTLGCETLDRDFADYEEYKEYIVPLGIKTIRLQGGWAKTEKVRGVYDFRWLDKIIDDAIGRGLNILLETDYGNPIYEGGGGWDLAAGLPNSEEGLAAWDRWVEAMAVHFKGRVRDWAMWNEPDNAGNNSLKSVAQFNVRTAKIIKRIIPDARIGGLSLAMCRASSLWECLMEIRRLNGIDLFTWFIYHCYDNNPEDCYAEVKAMRNVLKDFTTTIQLRQGENGCPSERTTRFALNGVDWTEVSQAKWDLERMLGDLGHDVESSIFTICDFNHIGREINRKGLLRANEQHKVQGPKLAYHAIRNLTSIFDDRLTRIPHGKTSIIAGAESSLYTYQDQSGHLLINYWDHDAVPGDSLEMRKCQIVLHKGAIQTPVLVDLLSGNVYDVPASAIRTTGEFQIFTDLPYGDCPMVLAEKSILFLE